MSGLSISELEFYSLPELIEAYRTIDKASIPIKTNVLEKQIRIKMNLPTSADLSSESIQKQFDQILSDYVPIKLVNDKNKKIVNKLRKVQLGSLITMMIFLVFMFIYKDYAIRLLYISLVVYGIFAAIEVVQSRYTGEILSGAINIKEEKYPQLFGCMQVFFLFTSIAILLLALAMIL